MKEAHMSLQANNGEREREKKDKECERWSE